MTPKIIPQYPVLPARDFLDMDFGNLHAELDDGAVRVLAERSDEIEQIAHRLRLYFVQRLGGTSFHVTGHDKAIVTSDFSIRRADVAVGIDVHQEQPWMEAFRPIVLIEFHTDRKARTDLRTKLDEYKALTSVETIVFVDIASERVRVVQRTGPNGWNEVAHAAPFDIPLPALDLVIPHDEIFARD